MRPSGGEVCEAQPFGQELKEFDGICGGTSKLEDGSHRLRESFGSGEVERFRSAHDVHGLKEARYAKDVVAMIVGEGDEVRLHEADACRTRRRLRSLAAVHEDGVPRAGEKCCRERPVGEWDEG
ncbi:MAG: hypothetical protein Q4A07_02585 [Coriobacteriales bacterium]|nr:hypothetical protein [Coriobacteriales bacterium]